MTESDRYPDPVEDRVRRTFAVRAEDMAAGDGTAGDQGLHELLAGPAANGSGSRQDRRPGRFLLAAAIVVIMGAALAAIGVVVANDGDDDAGEGPADVADDGDSRSDAPVATLVLAQRGLVMALQDERNLAAIELIGQEDMVVVPVDDDDEARRRTDAAIAALQTVADTDPVASAYQQAIDDLAGLAALRVDVDADAGPRNMSNVETANEIFDRYTRLVGGLLDAQRDLALTIDDPELRAGLEAHQLGMRQQELIAQLARATLLNAVWPGDPASLTEVSRLYDLVQQGQAELTAAADGTPYEEPAAAVVGQIRDSGLLDIVDTALDGTTDVAGLLAAVELPADEGWPAFLDRVEHLLATEG